MGRFYQLSKKISEQEASEIMREVLELPDIRDAEIIDDRSRVRVETKDNVFIDVMSTVVNIFRRVAGGCEMCIRDRSKNSAKLYQTVSAIATLTLSQMGIKTLLIYGKAHEIHSCLLYTSRCV